MGSCAVYAFAFGRLKIECQDGAVTLLTRTDEPVNVEGRSALTDVVYGQISEYLQGRRREFTFPYILRGSEFQMKVWRALCGIPYGQTRTYGEIAAAVGRPKACRAVGMANHHNPILIAVPCHRVIGANGKLTGYGGGLDMKEFLLALEQQSQEKSKKA